MKNLYFVERNKGNVMVSIMFNRMDNKYHFVNLTKGHICTCGFHSIDEAVQDMHSQKSKGIIKDFVKISECAGDKT